MTSCVAGNLKPIAEGGTKPSFQRVCCCDPALLKELTLQRFAGLLTGNELRWQGNSLGTCGVTWAGSLGTAGPFSSQRNSAQPRTLASLATVRTVFFHSEIRAVTLAKLKC